MPMLSGLYLAPAAWAWAAAGAGLLALELATGSGWLLWPAAAAGVVAVLAGVFELPTAAAVLLFAFLTILSTVTARRYFPRRLADEARDINDNIDRLMGCEAQVTVAFEARAGRVFVDGKEWAAELEAGERLDAGARVTVVGVAGARLKVRAVS